MMGKTRATGFKCISPISERFRARTVRSLRISKSLGSLRSRHPVGQRNPQVPAGREEFLLGDEVISIEHGPRFVAGEQHGDPFGHARADQIARGRAATVVQEPMRDLCLPSGVAQGVVPPGERSRFIAQS